MAKVNYTKQQGDTGTTITSGIIIGEEYNPKLRDENALRSFDEMARNDGTVNAALEVVKVPLKGASYEIDAASDDLLHIEQAALARKCLFEYVDWDQFFEELLTYLEFGFCLHEMIFEPRNVLGKDAIALTDLQYRKQTTIKRWTFQDGTTPGVTQITGLGKIYEIQEPKLFRMTHKQRGNNYQGISILRPAYKHWYIKDKLYKYDAVSHQKNSVGVVDVTVPKTNNDSDKAKVRKAAKSITAHEQSYVEHTDDYKIEMMDMKSNTLRAIEPSIDHHDRQIMKNVLAQFMEIGSRGSSGTRNVGQDQSRILEKAVQNIANSIVYRIQNTVIKTLIDLNYTDVDEYPKLRVSNLSDEDLTILSTAISNFVTAGVLHPRSEDENTIRKAVGWSQLSDEDIEKVYPDEGADGDADDTTTPDKTAGEKKTTDPESVDTEDLKASAALTQAHQLRDELNKKLYGSAGFRDQAA